EEAKIPHPAVKGSLRPGTNLGVSRLDLLLPGSQIGTQPIQGLSAQAGALLVAGFWGILAPTGGGQGGTPGCIVTIAGGQIVGWFRIGGKAVGVEPCGRCVEKF